MAAALTSPTTKRGKTPRAQTAAELARSEIPGAGPYLIASIAAYPNLCVPSPVPGTVLDLALTPFSQQVIDLRWLDSIPLMQAYRAGTLQLRFDTVIPPAGAPQLDDELTAGLDGDQVGWIRALCDNPLTQAFVIAIKLAETLGPNGLPAQSSPRVNKNYLKTEHVLILRAALDLERRCQKRLELEQMLEQQIAKIEAL